ncbi:N-acetylmuramoyl-L-alanine amidase family protein [Paenibacillus dakarensis]|uniref:N-acetylmuramoyl-L-alanine amidase family protein n=1 Tax=Paenibacillus dakarensis TaxID=1527293 RepID=UPI0006D52E1D|nr:N-acetylmuramoyl-L-alanine amidase [Paenibacillus dakarensis]
MYDLLIGLFESIFRHGWSLSSAGAIVFLLLKQKKMKNRLKKFLPFLFSDDSEVRVYMGNQLVIMKNLELIMKEMRIEPWVVNIGEEKPNDSVKKRSTSFISSWAMRITARDAEKSMKRRDLKMTKLLADGGHGGHDPGAIGFSGKREKDYALTMVKKLSERLKKDGLIQPILSRSDDTFIPLQDRVTIAKKNKVDAFLSIHLNSAGSIATGTETLYTRAESRKFAETVHKHLIKATGFKDRGVRYQNIHVTRETDMPAILVEVGFINNPQEEDKLFSQDHQNRVIEALVQGIYEYLGVKVEQKAEKPTYTEMEITVHSGEKERYTGYNIKGTTWIPSRPIGEMLGGRIGYKDGKVTINGNAVDTQNFGGVGFVKSRDLTKLLNARIFWDKENPNRVDIYTK